MPPEKDKQESTLTFKTWGLIALIAVIFGFFFVTVLAHEGRLTRVETIMEVTIANFSKSLDNLTIKIDRFDRHAGDKR